MSDAARATILFGFHDTWQRPRPLGETVQVIAVRLGIHDHSCSEASGKKGRRSC